MQQNISELQAHVLQLEAEKQKANERAERRAHQSSLLEREIATANALLRTFEEEDTASDVPMEARDQQLLIRIHDLEVALSQYKIANNDLQNELDAVSLGKDSRSVAQNSELSAECEARRLAEQGVFDPLL